ncbi:MAG: putative metalloprotease CJM1_0395 family protein [Pseudomonadota bacterium]
MLSIAANVAVTGRVSQPSQIDSVDGKRGPDAARTDLPADGNGDRRGRDLPRPVGPAQERSPTDGLGQRAQAGLFEARTGQAEQAPESASLGASSDGLSDEQEQMIKDLAARDREVRRHEEAHARVGGQYAGQPSYTYQTGPDGKRYAIGGEVPIDVAPVPDDPEATIEKMRVVKAAALAPAEPSGQDRRVAALADSQRLEAQADLNRRDAEELTAALEKVRVGRSGETDPLQDDRLAQSVIPLRQDHDPGDVFDLAA